jgi:hypothetical protein
MRFLKGKEKGEFEMKAERNREAPNRAEIARNMKRRGIPAQARNAPLMDRLPLPVAV